MKKETKEKLKLSNEMCEVVKDFSAGSKKIYFNGTLVAEDKLTAADFTLPFPDELAN